MEKALLPKCQLCCDQAALYTAIHQHFGSGHNIKATLVQCLHPLRSTDRGGVEPRFEIRISEPGAILT